MQISAGKGSLERHEINERSNLIQIEEELRKRKTDSVRSVENRPRKAQASFQLGRPQLNACLEEVLNGPGLIEMPAHVRAQGSKAMIAFCYAKHGVRKPNRTMEPSDDKGAIFPQNLSIGLNCTSGDVWIIVADGYHPVPEHIPPNIPDGICFQYLSANSYGDDSWFWERRTRTILEYLEQHPNVTFMIMTDTDVYVNPLSMIEVKTRFDQLATEEARIVVGVDQTCWFGYICPFDEANEWLKVVRESGTGQEDIRVFGHSQFMGEAEAVKAMIKRALEISPTDDQRAMNWMIKETPRKFAIDVNETLFLSLSRGFVDGVEDAWMVCNFGGNNTTKCGVNTTVPWGSCHVENGFIDVQGGNNWKEGTVLRALSLHTNGPAVANIPFAPGCQEAFDSVPSWY